MAILRGRQVTILDKHADSGIAPTYTVQYADGEKEFVLLSDLEITEEERDGIVEDHMHLLGPLKVIDKKKVK